MEAACVTTMPPSDPVAPASPCIVPLSRPDTPPSETGPGPAPPSGAPPSGPVAATPDADCQAPGVRGNRELWSPLCPFAPAPPEGPQASVRHHATAEVEVSHGNRVRCFIAPPTTTGGFAFQESRAILP